MLSTALSAKYFEDRYLTYIGSIALQQQLIAVVYVSSDPAKVNDETHNQITQKNLRLLKILLVIEDFSSGFSVDRGDITVKISNGKFRFKDISTPFWSKQMEAVITERLGKIIRKYGIKLEYKSASSNLPTQYTIFPIDDSSLDPELATLFGKLRIDMNELLGKIKHDSKGDTPDDLCAALEEAYLRALIIAEVITPFPENVA